MATPIAAPGATIRKSEPLRISSSKVVRPAFHASEAAHTSRRKRLAAGHRSEHSEESGETQRSFVCNHRFDHAFATQRLFAMLNLRSMQLLVN